MITRRSTLASLGALLAGAAGAPGVLAQTAKPARPKLIEPPFLEPLVQKNELPAIAKRVPEAPWIVSLAGDKTPGEYGGDLRILMARDRDARFMVVYGYARLVGYDENLGLVADLCERFTVEEERIFTFHLRKGHRWSNGRPFTSEDFRYFWEDVVNFRPLDRMVGMSQDLLVNGEKPKVEFPDPLTVRYAWSRPNPRFLPALAGASPLYIYRPSHYLRRYHVKYADKKLIEELKQKYKGDERGWAREHVRRDRPYRNTDPRLPSLEPWVIKTEPPSERFEFHRNPYFHRIDENGRQLPYIDRVLMVLAESKIIPAKSGAGESDLQARNLRFDDFTFLKRASRQRGTFNVRLWHTANGAQLAFYPNLNVEDPAWRGLMRDVRVRRALSLAIDRREINEIMYVGLAHPGANTVLPGSPLFKKEYREAPFDLAAANRLLDEAGLARRGAGGARLLPDGEPLELIVEYPSEGTEYSDSLRLIGSTWAKAGLKMFSKATRRELLRRRVASGHCMMSYWGGLDFALVGAQHSPHEFVPHREDQPQWPKWGMWAQSNGQMGDQPDDPAALALVKLHEEWFAAADDGARRAAWERILAIWTEQTYTIGIIGGVLQPVVVSNRLRNLPIEGVYAFDPGAHFGRYRPDTLWLAERNGPRAARAPG